MPKKVSEIQRKELIDSFINGKTIEELSKEFNFTKITIIRNLKKGVGEKDYKNLLEKNNQKKERPFDKNCESMSFEEDEKSNIKAQTYSEDETFIEIAPLDYEIENIPRKELSSVPIGEIEFPKIVYMIVNKNIELEIKLLKDYPEWEFLPNEDLKRKTIEIYFDLKTAKRVCSKEQKVIKIPNTDVFRIASPFLISRGISRIVSAEKLIAI